MHQIYSAADRLDVGHLELNESGYQDKSTPAERRHPHKQRRQAERAVERRFEGAL